MLFKEEQPKLTSLERVNETTDEVTNEISDVPIGIGGTITKPSKYVRNLGVMLDSRMTMEKHVNSVSRSCFMQLRQIGRIRPYVSVDAK